MQPLEPNVLVKETMLNPQDYPAEKVLQSPRQFAYSDSPKEQMHVEEQSEEKYAKGAGQQYSSKHKSFHGTKKAKGN